MKRILLVGLVVIALALFPATTAFAQGPVDPGLPIEVTTGAMIAPGGQAPLVEWAWGLPDMDDTAPGVQYLFPYDDDPALGPDPALIPTAPNMFQVVPNPEDQPAEQLIAFWMAVEDPNGTANIGIPVFHVFHPDGSLKYKLHTAEVACTAIGTVDATGAPIDREPVLDAAIYTGQMTTAEADEMIERCYKNEKAIYMAVGTLSKEQPWGEYRLESTAVDLQGNVATIVSYFDVLPMVALRIDFNNLNFGSILPNTPSWLSGDRVFAPPADDQPTVMNVGNAQMFVHIAFTRMQGARFGNFIDVFDARLGTTELPPFPALTPGGDLNWQCFAGTSLGPNQVGQLDLSIHPGYLEADTFAGLFYIAGAYSCGMVTE